MAVINEGYTQSLNGTQSRTNLVDVNSRGSIFQKREFYKNATILLILVIVLLSLGLIIMVVYYVNSNKELKLAKRVCISEECLRSASNLRWAMDESVDPCEDFYQYTCGHWSEEHPNHGWYPKFSTFEVIEERVTIATLNFLSSNASEDDPLPVKQTRMLQKSCLDLEALNNLGYTVILKYLKKVGLPEVPSLFKNVGDDFKFDWISMSVNLKRTFAMNLFIQLDVDADVFNRSNYVMYAGSGIHGSPLPTPFKTDKKSLQEKLKRSETADQDDDDDGDDEEQQKMLAKIEQGSKRAIKQIFKVILENVTTVPEDKLLDKAVDMLWNISSDIATLASANTTDMLNLEVLKISVKELQNLTDDFLLANNAKPKEVWKPFITKLFKGVENSTFNFETDVLYISLPEISYLCNIVLYLSRMPDVVMELYNWWAVVKAMIISTTTDISEYIYKETSLPSQDENEVITTRSLECAQLVNNFMGIAVSYGIADKAFMNNTMPKVEQMLHNIKEAFVHRVNEIDWMDKETKAATLEKSKEMISFIGFPEWLLNKTAIEIYYANITISPTTYLDNMMQFVEEITLYQLNMFKHENEKTWRTDPTTVNAYNYFGDNSINVPMAILTFPMYHLGLEVLNYGAIGSILGHELTHGFDNLGRKYDKDGNFLQWWTNETIKIFEEKTKCFEKQYDKFELPSHKVHVDGKMTLGENLADNGGLHHSYLAYQNYLRQSGEEDRLPGFEKYNTNQMFFIAFGSIWCEIKNDAATADQIESDEHSPSQFRVLGTLQNSHEFAQAFNCPVGSKMNPNRTRCRIW